MLRVSPWTTLLGLKGRGLPCIKSWTVFGRWLVCLLADPRTKNISASGNFVALVRELGALISLVPLVVLFVFVLLPSVRRCCSEIECS